MLITDIKGDITAAELWDYKKAITVEMNEDFDYLKPDEKFILENKYVYLYRKAYLVSSINVQGVLLAYNQTDTNISFTRIYIVPSVSSKS